MTTYTALSNTAVAVGGIPSGATVTVLRDNPIAIAEGAAGAPKVVSLALNIATGAATVTTGTSVFTSLDGIATLAVNSSLTLAVAGVSSAGTATARYRLSSNTGGSWGGYVTLLAVGGTNNDSGSSTTERASNMVDVGVSTFDAIEFSCALSGNTSRSLDIFFLAIEGET